ncbi:MAG TPA: GNAT family N-acetyltransferase [Polyangia bacterium]|nr:GNAT family N-acetyltransferase [Polyangia bacterium]
MDAHRRWSIEWRTQDGVLRAAEPTAAEVVTAAGPLAEFYNEPHNRQMMTNTVAMTADEVIAYYAGSDRQQVRPFLLARDGVLVGDGDLRGIRDGTAETAILIGDRRQQGRGLGTRFAIMLHAFAFRVLCLDRVYAAIIPGNTGSRRLFEKLGHQIDVSVVGRTFAEEPSDVILSVDAEKFCELHRDFLGEIAFQPWEPVG